MLTSIASKITPKMAAIGNIKTFHLLLFVRALGSTSLVTTDFNLLIKTILLLRALGSTSLVTTDF
ncbi:MAG: hypothetical protein Q8L90_17800 [Bacteroidota bacterium]|nr:hypothetical protein [Bacteroidota bacterium]